MQTRIPVGGGSRGRFIKWADVAVGTILEGTLSGTREGKYGLLVDLETADGALTLPVPVALERQLGRVRVGGQVAIEYAGMKENPKSGHSFHNFSVFVEDVADLLPATKRQRTPADDERLPF